MLSFAAIFNLQAQFGEIITNFVNMIPTQSLKHKNDLTSHQG